MFNSYLLLLYYKVTRSGATTIVLIWIVSGCIFCFLFVWGRLPFSKQLRSSSIFKQIEVVFHISSCWVEIMLHTKNHLHRLPRAKFRLSSIYKIIRSSSIFKNIEVVFHISSSWVKLRLHTENQLPRLPRTALIVMSVFFNG